MVTAAVTPRSQWRHRRPKQWAKVAPRSMSRGGSCLYRLDAAASDGDSYGQAGLVENAYPSPTGS